MNIFEGKKRIPPSNIDEDTRFQQGETLRPSPVSSFVASSLVEMASRGMKMLESEKVQPATHSRRNDVSCYETQRLALKGDYASRRQLSRSDMKRMARDVVHAKDPEQWERLKADLAKRGPLTHYGLQTSLGELLETRVREMQRERESREKSIDMELLELPSEEKSCGGHSLGRLCFGEEESSTTQTEHCSGLSNLALLADDSVSTIGGIISFVGDCAKKVCSPQDSRCATSTNSWHGDRPEATPLDRGEKGMNNDEMFGILGQALQLGS